MATRTASIPVPALEATDGAGAPAAVPHVEGALRALDKAIRAFQLYQGASGSYIPFLETVRDAFASVWRHTATLVLEVEQSRFLCAGVEVWKGQARRGDLAYLFHRDGVREIIFFPGFETSELEEFISLLSTAYRLRSDQDDLITLLWERDFKRFRYFSVDALTSDPDHPEEETPPLASIDIDQLQGEMLIARGPVDRTPSLALRGISSDHGFQFRETLHFLDPGELRKLDAELQRELGRDVLRDVLHALFDRMDDGCPERQRRILTILVDMLPGLIGNGELAAAVLVLEELSIISVAEAPCHAAVRDEARALFDRLGEPETVSEMVRVLQDLSGPEEVLAYATLLRYFPSGALVPLIVAAEEAAQPEVRCLLWELVEAVAAAEPEQVLALLEVDSDSVVLGAVRLVGRLRLVGGAPVLGRLVLRGEPRLRLAAIEALRELPCTLALGSLGAVLQDAEREVRLAALHALAVLRYAPARAPLEALVTSRWIRECDRAERVAAFEAYGAVAGAAAIPLLERILHGRNWLRRRRPAEERACAALGLGRIDDPRARETLAAAAHDPDAVVRTAASRGLKREPR